MSTMTKRCSTIVLFFGIACARNTKWDTETTMPGGQGSDEKVAVLQCAALASKVSVHSIDGTETKQQVLPPNIDPWGGNEPIATYRLSPGAHRIRFSIHLVFCNLGTISQEQTAASEIAVTLKSGSIYSIFLEGNQSGSEAVVAEIGRSLSEKLDPTKDRFVQGVLLEPNSRSVGQPCK